jgi:hypothetical protein
MGEIKNQSFCDVGSEVGDVLKKRCAFGFKVKQSLLVRLKINNPK